MKLFVNIRVLYFLVIILLTSCSDGTRTSEIKAQIDDLKRQAMAQKKKAADLDVQDPQAVVYKPFTSTEDDEDTEVASQDHKIKGNVNPLNQYPLNDYQYVGIVEEDSRVYAYLLAPDGALYRVREGDLLGTTHAKVDKITDGQIQVLEKKILGDNKIVEKVKTIELKGDQNEKTP